jgi:hypothetical protein
MPKRGKRVGEIKFKTMQKKDENALSMMYTVKEGCDLKTAVWTPYRPFVTSYGLFTAKIPIIEQYRDQQVIDIKGHALDKDASRTAITETAFQFSSGLASFAKSTGNNTLLKAVDYTMSELKGLRDTTLIGACNILIKKAGDNLLQLSDYQITQLLIDQFRTAVGQYQAVVSAPRLAIAGRKTAGGLLSKHIRDAKLILKERVDVDAEHFKNINPEFYEMYQNARNVPDYGTRKKGQTKTIVNGDCVDFETHTALSGVLIKILGQGVEMITGADGKFSLIVKTPGEIIVRAEKEGCHPWEDDLIMEAGDVLTIMIEMEKIEE